jgi:predicted deacylase
VILLVVLGMPLPSHGQTPTQTAIPIRDLTIGSSVQGRPITAVQIGDGVRKLVVVGDTHGGPEANTYQLATQLAEHFRLHPNKVPPEVRLYIIPTLNPDGLALDTRFNANNVDLNRNMNTNLDACPENDWGSEVFGAYGIVSNTGGDFPDSEGESRLIRSFLLDAAGAIFLHSNAGLVFPPYCEHSPSIRMAQIYAQASGYAYNRYWDKYVITGGMHDWAGSIGIAAIIPELISGVDSEFAPNLAGVHAVLTHAEEVLPLPADQVVGDVVVPAIIWRYWRTHGGERIFGVPIEPAHTTADGVSQLFTNAQLKLEYSQIDTPYLVQPAALGKTDKTFCPVQP